MYSRLFLGSIFADMFIYLAEVLLHVNSVLQLTKGQEVLLRSGRNIIKGKLNLQCVLRELLCCCLTKIVFISIFI